MRRLAVAAALAVAACGGETTVIDESTGSGGSGPAPGSGATSSGGRTGASGGAISSGGTPGAGGVAPPEPCSRRDLDGNSGCPLSLSAAMDAFGLGCDDGLRGGGCVFEGEACGLVAVRILSGLRAGARTCLYDANTGSAVGSSIGGGGSFSCVSYSDDFPREGFTTGDCGPGSFGDPS